MMSQIFFSPLAPSRPTFQPLPLWLMTHVAQQYTLTLTPEVEVRYRTETRTDSEGNDYDVEVPYNYHILG